MLNLNFNKKNVYTRPIPQGFVSISEIQIEPLLLYWKGAIPSAIYIYLYIYM